METTGKNGSEDGSEKGNSVWDYLINHYVEIIVNDGIDSSRPHIIKKTGVLLGTDSNFVFIRRSIKIEALAIKNIERIGEVLDNNENGFNENGLKGRGR